MLTPSNTRLYLTMIFLSFLLVACGSDYMDDDDFQQEQTQEQSGTFETPLNPMNGGTTEGQAVFIVGEDDFTANLTSQRVPATTTIRQYLLSGNTCPENAATLADAQLVTGPILIPLDNDLSGQYVGGQFPLSDTEGNTVYQAQSNLEDMITDLRNPDPVDDNIRKLSPDELLNMEGRTVMMTFIDGTNEIPLACGVLIRR